MKVRIKFSKQGNLRFVGHLDMMRYFQKAFRRSGLPISYSEGFSPHQIMSFAAPLGMGLEGLGEYFDIRVPDEGTPVGSDEAMERLNQEMAEGLEILSYLAIPDNTGNCMAAVHAADYTVRFLPGSGDSSTGNGSGDSCTGNGSGDGCTGNDSEGGCGGSIGAALASALSALLAKPEILVTKKGKKGNLREVDLRPMIFSAEAEGDALLLRIAQGSEANLKPELLLEALYAADAGGTLKQCKTAVVRTELYDAEGKALEAYGSRIA